MNEWQLIDTAPTDGKSFLAWCPIYRNIFCMVFDELGEGFTIFGGNGCSALENPTHWMDLPEPPNSLAFMEALKSVENMGKKK